MNTTLTQLPSGRFRIWDPPADGRSYVIGVDVAEGKIRDRSASARRKLYSYSNEQPDYTAACVIDMETAKHVASWHGKVPPEQFVPALVAMGRYYNNALIVPEVNGPGIVIVSGLRELEYPAIYRSRTYHYVQQDPLRDELGWRTSAINRPLLIKQVGMALEIEAVTRDAALIDEIRTMQFDANGVARARGHNKDDRVFAFALALIGRHEYLAQDRPPATGDRPEMRHLSPDDRAVYAAMEQKQQHGNYLRPGRPGWRPVRRL